MYPTHGPGLTAVLAPSAVVARGKWVDSSGDVMAVAGGRARGVAAQNFSTAEVGNVAGSPGNRLAVVIFGSAKVILGGAVGDKKFVTCDAVGDTVEAGTANDEILGYAEKGGADGDEVEVFVLRNEDARMPAAAIATLAGAGSGAADGTLEAEGLLATVGGNTYADADVNAILTKIENNIAELAGKVAAIQVVMRSHKIIAT